MGQMLLCACQLVAVTITKASMGERDCCCVRLRVHVLVRVPSSVVLRVCVRAFVCVCVPVGVRVCQFCTMRYWRYWFFEESASVVGERCHMFCFHHSTDPKVWNTTLQSFNCSRGLWLCAEFVGRAVWQVPSAKTCVTPPYSAVTLQLRDKTNCCCRGSKQCASASQSSSVKALLMVREQWFCLFR